MRDTEKERRSLRSKIYNVLERVEQLEGEDKEIGHVDSAIKSLVHCWEEYKKPQGP